MRRLLLAFLLLLCAPFGLSQTYGLMIYDGAKWVPATTTASAGAVTAPTGGQVKMLCYNTGLGKWVPADSSCFGGGSPATALTPNPTIPGQAWGYIPGSAPNQGWSLLTENWVNVADYGAVCDGVTPDDAAFTAALAASSGTPTVLVIPATSAFYCLLNSPKDFSALFTILAFDGILYNGTDAGPAITLNGQRVIGNLEVDRNTDTANQIMIQVGAFGGVIDGLVSFNGNSQTDNTYIGVDFENTSGPAVVQTINSDAPIKIGNNTGPTSIQTGTINGFAAINSPSADPIQLGGIHLGLNLGDVKVYSANVSNSAACFIKLSDQAFQTVPLTLSGTLFGVNGSYTGHILCGPSTVTTVPPLVNGSIGTFYAPTTLFSGKVYGTLTTPSNNNGSAGGSAENPAIVYTNEIASSGFYYSAAGTALPTPAFTLVPATAFVSDQTTACSGNYASGGAVKCSVRWDGTNWKAF